MSSTYDEDYRELIEGVRDAALELLRVSTPDSLMGLRREYTELRRLLDRDDQERSKAESQRDDSSARQARAEEIMNRRAVHDIWRAPPTERRESFVFHALGDERLTLREMTARLNVILDAPKGYSIVYESNLRSIVMRMFHAGQLERVEETFKNKPRYRYFRKRGLDGPIALRCSPGPCSRSQERWTSMVPALRSMSGQASAMISPRRSPA